MTDSVRMSLAQVHDTARRLLLAQGFSEPHAEAIANTVTAAERDECRHHGLFRIAFYVNALKAGQASGEAEPTLTDLAPAIVRVDGHNGFSPLPLERGHAPLVERARAQGIAALAVNNALNVAALWPEVERLADDGLVAFAFVSAIPYVAPYGGIKPVFGTNPMAFAWPRPGRHPLVFDQASSMSARGEIQIRMRDGKPLEPGWAIDADGNPTTDGKAALAGAQLPFGGAKGSAIAMMVELLAGPLIGDVLSVEAGERDVAKTGAPCGGELVIAIDPTKAMPNGDLARQAEHAERLFSMILEQEGTRLPSDRRYRARERTTKEGVDVPASLHASLMELLAGRYSGARADYEGDPETGKSAA
ncbi:Ldh family oxidoreductase [Acuticoccus mangrovi]|uniref:Ldh family oxidoreductase n=1 Tax=Acuticoccus mangrovi TaxID=2796142 RepID=A0A934ME69_9HYPH|nr:Ldh family oxidoreductase [Acuticoccus mangrovi]MBJ3774058.1 Ldh family oxidoreductase [Acuticoccus mangrovi]